MNNEEIELLRNAGIQVKDKEYLQEDFNRMEQQIVEYIMSASSKNGDIDKLRNKYEGIFRVLIKKWYIVRNVRVITKANSII